MYSIHPIQQHPELASLWPKARCVVKLFAGNGDVSSVRGFESLPEAARYVVECFPESTDPARRRKPAADGAAPSMATAPSSVFGDQLTAI